VETAVASALEKIVGVLDGGAGGKGLRVASSDMEATIQALQAAKDDRFEAHERLQLSRWFRKDGMLAAVFVGLGDADVRRLWYMEECTDRD